MKTMTPSGDIGLTIVGAFMLVGFAVGCALFWFSQPKLEEAAKTNEPIYQQSTVDDVVGGIQYLKDPRGSTCFALYRDNGSHSIASVPCERITNGLLTTARLDLEVGDIQYFKDPRTSMCFGLYRSNDDRSIASVPCERITTGLLVTARLNLKAEKE